MVYYTLYMAFVNIKFVGYPFLCCPDSGGELVQAGNLSPLRCTEVLRNLYVFCLCPFAFILFSLLTFEDVTLKLNMGNVLLPASESGLPKDSVVNVSQVITVDRVFLTEKCGRVPSRVIRSIDEGLRLVFSL